MANRVHLVSDEDLEGLVRSLTYIMSVIEINDRYKALYTLDKLKDNIKKTLKEETNDERK